MRLKRIFRCGKRCANHQIKRALLRKNFTNIRKKTLKAMIIISKLYSGQRRNSMTPTGLLLCACDGCTAKNCASVAKNFGIVRHTYFFETITLEVRKLYFAPVEVIAAHWRSSRIVLPHNHSNHPQVSIFCRLPCQNIDTCQYFDRALPFFL